MKECLSAMEQQGVRINKYIADSGLCSRREADTYISEGKVRLNGRKAKMGDRVMDGDSVSVNGKEIGRKKEKHVYIALNKPAGIVCTADTREEANVIDFVGHPRRVFPIGRLDKDSEGLLLLTTDGDIVNRLLRAENRHEKEYIVTVNKSITQEFLRRMASGVEILDTVTLPCKIRQSGPKQFTIILTQGLNRQIRRMCEALGYRVLTLERVRIMNIRLGHLKRGRWRNLNEGELAELKQSLGMR